MFCVCHHGVCLTRSVRAWATLFSMKRFLGLLVILFSVAQAQTLEVSAGLPFTAQIAISNVVLSDVISVGAAVSTERVKVSADGVLDFSVVGSLQARVIAEVAYVGRFRVQLLARGSFGPIAANLGVAYWNAAPANFDPFEIFATDPLPNSGIGFRTDLGIGYRVNRNFSVFGAGRFGSDFSSFSLEARVRDGEFEFRGGLLGAVQTTNAAILAQASAIYSPEELPFTVSLGAGFGFTQTGLAYEGQLTFAWIVLEEVSLSVNAVYQPWRVDVLPFRGSLEVRINPGFGTILLTGYLGYNQVNTWVYGARIAFRITLEELFPSPEEARVSSGLIRK